MHARSLSRLCTLRGLLYVMIGAPATSTIANTVRAVLNCMAHVLLEFALSRVSAVADRITEDDYNYVELLLKRECLQFRVSPSTTFSFYTHQKSSTIFYLYYFYTSFKSSTQTLYLLAPLVSPHCCNCITSHARTRAGCTPKNLFTQWTKSISIDANRRIHAHARP
jgi:hypothetical protein